MVCFHEQRVTFENKRCWSFCFNLSHFVLLCISLLLIIAPQPVSAGFPLLDTNTVQNDTAVSNAIDLAVRLNSVSDNKETVSVPIGHETHLPKDKPQERKVYTQNAPSSSPDKKIPAQDAGLTGAWERFLKLFTVGAVPDGESSSVRDWFDQRAQILRFNVTGIFTRSKFQGNSDPLEGGSIFGVFAPALRLSEDTALAAVYTGSYTRELQVFTEDEGPRQQQEEQRHEFIFLLSHDIFNPFGSTYIDRLTLSPSFFQTYVFTRQTGDEEWGNGLPWRGVDAFKGLYDYWDRGGGFEIKAVHQGEARTQNTFSMAFQIYRRHYRNFISLARLLDPTSPEPKFEKDYIGYLARAVYDHRSPDGPTLRLAYTFLQKNFTEDRADKDPLETPGIPSERRKDRTHTIEGRGTVPITQVPGLTIGLFGTGAYNTSNSGFNDTLAPLPPTGVFADEYYDYWSIQVGPEVAYSQKIDAPFLNWRLTGVLTLAASYSFERRAYRDRKAKDGAGNIKDQNEVDITHVITPRVIYQFNRNWATFLQWRRTIGRSNFKDERTFQYNYDINSFGLGIQFSY